MFLQNLPSLSELSLSSCTMNVLSSIPNLKKLKLVETEIRCSAACDDIEEFEVQSNDEDDKLSYYLIYFGLVYINIWTVFYVHSFSSFVV